MSRRYANLAIGKHYCKVNVFSEPLLVRDLPRGRLRRGRWRKRRYRAWFPIAQPYRPVDCATRWAKAASAAPTFFNQPHRPMIWTVSLSLSATFGALFVCRLVPQIGEETAGGRWAGLFSGGGFETRLQLTGGLLECKLGVCKGTPSQRDRQQTGTAKGGYAVIGLPEQLDLIRLIYRRKSISPQSYT